MKTFTIFLLILVFPWSGKAQWNNNTFVNLQISSLPTADMQTASTTDGKTWIAFYHQNGGNYDMRAQLIDANGYKLLGTDGVLVSNQPSGSATYVFNVCVDASNNLVIAFQDQRSGPLGAVVYKISEAGTQLWGSSGIVLGQGLSPYPAVLSTGETVVAWSESVSNTINLQKISAAGTLVWGSPIQVTVGATLTTRGQVIGNLGGKFTLVYQKKGVGISTTLYAQHFDNSGTALYAALQICNLTTSAARYYSLAAEGDTTYCGYYASSGSRFNSYLQRINPAGTIPYGINGSNFNTSVAPADNYQMTTNINLTPGSPYVWSVCTFSNTSQTTYGVYIQKFLKTTGARLFTDGAKVVYAISSSTDQQIGGLALVNDTPMFMNYDVSYKIYATRLDANGNFVWPGNRVELSSTTATLAVPKMRYGFTPDGPNRCAGIWTENRGANYLGYAQGISIGGLIGVKVATQGNVPATITTPGGTLQMVDTVFPSTANQNVTWSIVTGTGNASISTGGLVTAIANGTVYAKAIAVQDITVKDSLLITISGQSPTGPTVVTLAATNITTNSATLNGTVTANNSSTTVSFDWGLTVAYGSSAAATPSTVTGNTPTAVLANLSGLALTTLYHYRCKGVNANGTAYGVDMTFTTGCNAAGAAGPITGPATVCYNATGKVYSVAAIPNATGYTWSVPAGATIVSGQNTTSITVNFGTNSGNVSVFGTNSCSSGPSSNLAVSVDPPPVPTITGTTNLCLNSGTYTYSTEAGMSNYIWSVSSGGSITSGSGTNVIQVTWNIAGAQTVSVSYTSTAGCTAAAPTVLPVTVNQLPAAAGPITGTPVLCAGTTGVAYSVAVIQNAVSYVWSLPAGGTIASGNLTNNITVDFASNATSGNITVVGNNICGDGAVSPPFAVTVNPIPPTPTITQNGAVLTSDATSGNQWYFAPTPAGPFTAIPGATGQFYSVTQLGAYYDIVTLNGCSSGQSNMIIYVEGIPGVSEPYVVIYPIPNDGIFNISINTPSPESYTISILNNLGVKIREIKNVTVTNTSEQVIDLRPVPSGVYTVIIQNSQYRIVRKILVGK